MCGLVGLVAERDVAADICGCANNAPAQGAGRAGIMTCHDGKLMQRKVRLGERCFP